MDQHIKRKLQFEWKNIYRRLAQLAINPVPVATFNQICVQCGVILSSYEVAKLSNDNMVNFKELSKEVSG